jgi:hypothetical protein
LIGEFPIEHIDMHAGIGAVLDGATARRTGKCRGNGKGRGRAQRGTAEWMSMISMSDRASDLPVPLARSRLRPREQVHRFDIWRCQAASLFLL